MMDFDIKVYTIFDPGQRTDSQGRPHQEDSIYPAHGEAKPSDRLFIVCDGMGAHDAGEVASETVCQAMSQSILADQQRAGHKFTSADLQRAIVAAYDALDRKDSGAPNKMGTTLALLKLYDRGYLTAHIGDSRVYHIRPGSTAAETSIIFCTEDHSLVNHMVRAGEMTPEEARVSPKRNVITRAMQPNMDHRCRADVHGSSDVKAGDYFMVCSDGMLEYITDEYLCYIFSEEGGNDRNKMALLNRGSKDSADNHSAIVVHIMDVTSYDTQATQQTRMEHVAIKAPVISETGTKTTTKPRKSNDKKDMPARTVDVNPSTLGRVTMFVKLLFIVMAILVLCMLVYYLFIHDNEDLQRAGTAVDPTLEQQADGVETYGYEITQQDIINEAQEIAPEPSQPTDDPVLEDDDEPQPTVAADVVEPQPSSPEPILQE